MKSSSQIRQEFFDFFEKKEHTVVPSASLLPVGDKTLLFTNAGMNQFKDIFLGSGQRDYSRATDTQKCMRVSGKHNDLDDVGRDTYHHTFFEMLGNWSFGDYYKKEAIVWAWELFTDVWKLPKDKLWATVYREDHEAYQLWKDETDVAPEQLLYFDEKDNFWEMGDTGPCGPCSEIHFDLGEEACDIQGVAGHICGVNGDCGRYIELWNLVFIQYNRQTDGTLKDLPKKHVDTGMGFERIVSVLQGKKSNYDSDLFVPLIAAIEKLSSKKYSTENGIAMRVIADHVRALSFAIADGIMPSNEGRGYVIRRILRRALRFALQLGLDKPFLGKLLPVLIDIFDGTFPELERNKTRLEEVLQYEEERFFSTLLAGMQELDQIIARIREKGENVLTGDHIFQLYDSMGFPVDICEEVAHDEEMEFDRAGFDALMEEQKARGRKSWKGAQADAFAFLPTDIKPTEYNGEFSFESEGRILLLCTEDAIVDQLDAGSEGYMILDTTPFYAESGGQVADQGSVGSGSSKAQVLDVFKKEAVFMHKVSVNSGFLKKGEKVTLSVEGERKRSIARNHTATHLLQQALVDELGEHIAQAGSLVEKDRLRFDFSHFKAIPREVLDKVELRVNDLVRANIVVEKEEMEKDAAVAKGAKAFFGEKYEDKVRVVSIGDYSMELCGGTHVEQTGDIGLVKIISESSISSGVRRIEAVTGSKAFEEFQLMHRSLLQLSDMLNTAQDSLVGRVSQLTDKVRSLEKEIAKISSSDALGSLAKLGENAKDIDGVKVIIGRADNADAKVVKEAVDNFKNQFKDCVALVAGENKGKCFFILGAAGKPLSAGFNSKEVVNKVAAIAGGGGGGRPDMAQAGGKDVAKLADALEQAEDIIASSL